jgi:hypothetical protein
MAEKEMNLPEVPESARKRVPFEQSEAAYEREHGKSRRAELEERERREGIR